VVIVDSDHLELLLITTEELNTVALMEIHDGSEVRLGKELDF